jgi:hypothetical protein
MLTLPEELEALRYQIDQVPPKQRQGYIKALTGEATRTKAIAMKCYDCCAWQRKQPLESGQSIDLIKDCPVRGCPLWAYRPGARRVKKKSISSEHKQKLVSAAKKAREARTQNTP